MKVLMLWHEYKAAQHKQCGRGLPGFVHYGWHEMLLNRAVNKSVGQHHFYWQNPVIFPSLVTMGDDVLRNWGHEWRSMMKLLTLALGAVLFALAAAPSANAWMRPEWVVVRWANADCKIWHNDTNAPVGYGWRPVAFAGTWGGAYWKMGRLYQMHVCV